MSVAELPKTEEAAPARPHDGGLPLDSLEIKNFRAFRHLTIEKLGRVNLITGRNNVGKTALLEALWVFLNKGSLTTIQTLLSGRQELRTVTAKPSSIFAEETPSTKELLDAALSLYFGRPQINEILSKNGIREIRIGSLNHSEKYITLVVFHRRSIDNVSETKFTSPSAFPVISQPELSDYLILAGKYETDSKGNEGQFIADNIYKIGDLGARNAGKGDLDNFMFVRSSGLTDIHLGRIWEERIALTELEEETVRSLRIIHPGIEQIGFRESRDLFDSRVPYVRIHNQSYPVPLRSLGEGMNRLLGVSVSINACANGFILIDEIENGLHHSILADVWRLAFDTARRLNVQVFATTHSWECIEAFQQVAAEDEQSEGVLIRLQREGENVTSTVFDERRLAIMTRRGLEVR